MANLRDPLLADKLASIMAFPPKTLTSHPASSTIVQSEKRQTVIDYILRQLTSELPPIPHSNLQSLEHRTHLSTCKLKGMLSILQHTSSFSPASIDAIINSNKLDKSFGQTVVPDWNLESFKLIYLPLESYTFPVYPKVTNFPLTNHSIYLVGKLYAKNPTPENLAHLLRLTKQDIPLPPPLSLFRQRRFQYPLTSEYHAKLQQKLKLNLQVERNKRVLYSKLLHAATTRYNTLQQLSTMLNAATSSTSTHSKSSLNTILNNVLQFPELQKSLNPLSKNLSKVLKTNTLKAENTRLRSKLDKITSLYFPSLKSKFPRAKYLTLHHILLNLINLSFDDPEHPYIIINPIDHWQAYIELLIQAGIAEPHPRFPQLLKLVDFLK